MNYKHLRYFMEVAKSGSVTRASEQLHLTPQTVSAQIQLLEEALGSVLLVKRGRGLTLTDAGRVTLGYAQEIFSLGAELEQSARDYPNRERARQFRIGVVDALSKSITYRLIEPATQLAEPVQIVCREWTLDNLVAELALHRLDLVISDAPMPASASVRAYSHRLGECGVSFFAVPALVDRLAGAFPACLEGAPMLMPSEDSAIGQRLRAWFAAQSVHPRVAGEFDDSALAKEFGRHGAGVFIGATVLAAEIQAQYGVRTLGVAADVVEEFFAISVERRVTHPCVVAITQSARNELFAMPAKPRSRGPVAGRA